MTIWILGMIAIVAVSGVLAFNPQPEQPAEREADEVLDVLVDLLEIAAADIEKWSPLNPTRVRVCFGDERELQYEKGGLSVKHDGCNHRYTVNGLDTGKRGSRIARQLFADYDARQEQESKLRALQSATRALKVKPEPAAPVDPIINAQSVPELRKLHHDRVLHAKGLSWIESAPTISLRNVRNVVITGNRFGGKDD